MSYYVKITLMNDHSLMGCINCGVVDTVKIDLMFHQSSLVGQRLSVYNGIVYIPAAHFETLISYICEEY